LGIRNKTPPGDSRMATGATKSESLVQFRKITRLVKKHNIKLKRGAVGSDNLHFCVRSAIAFHVNGCKGNTYTQETADLAGVDWRTLYALEMGFEHGQIYGDDAKLRRYARIGKRVYEWAQRV
jgi:hypothetical protein